MSNQEPIQLTAILNKLLACNQKHIHQPEMGRWLDCAVVIRTYCFAMFDYCPIVFLTSPVPACGKTTLLDWFKKYTNNPVMAGNLSGPALFRTVEKLKPTFLMDEWDQLHDETKRDIMGLLNNGFEKRSGNVMRCDTANFEVKNFDTYCPKIICSLGLEGLIDSTASRSIEKKMQKYDNQGERLPRISKIDSTEIKEDIQRWVKENKDDLEKKIGEDDIPLIKEMSDRQMDMWEGFFQIFSFADNEWQSRIRQAGVYYSSCNTVDVISRNEMILNHCRDCINQRGQERISSMDLRVYINGQDDWKGYYSETLTPHKLNSLMRDFGLPTAQVLRFSDKGGATARGWCVESFNDAFNRYLRPCETVTP